MPMSGQWGYDMPQNRLVDTISINGAVYGLQGQIDPEQQYTDDDVMHSDELTGVQLELGENVDLLTMSVDDIIGMVNDILPELSSQVLESIVLIRDELIIADEIITLGERFEAGEQDWEL